MTRVVYKGVHHECGACDGRVLGLVPFEDLLAPTEGARVWREAEHGAVVGRCPFCRGDMRAPEGEDGTGGLALCRHCEQVWVPAGAGRWMQAHAAQRERGATPASGVPTACPTCGAPFSPDPAGRCRYCHTALVAASAIVVALPPITPPTASGVLRDAAGGLVRSVVDLLTENW